MSGKNSNIDILLSPEYSPCSFEEMSAECQRIGGEYQKGLENKGYELVVEELQIQLLKEVQSKKKNSDAIKEIQKNSFEIRKRDIQEKTSDKCVVGDIAAEHPFFFQINECIVSITFFHLY